MTIYYYRFVEAAGSTEQDLYLCRPVPIEQCNVHRPERTRAEQYQRSNLLIVSRR
ncbi:MAG TPA: hypothetical protein VFR09_01770 [Alphaproteobacteria bacterium]|nr:hypothetical protein [Alphaproteobacteria bacterium]